MAAKITPTDYDSLLKLCKREYKEYRIGHNTRARRNGESIVVIYHSTIIATIERSQDGTMFVMVLSGGWNTPTTKDRINKFLPSRWSLIQRDYSWFLNDSRNGQVIPFTGAAYFVDGKVQ